MIIKSTEGNKIENITKIIVSANNDKLFLEFEGKPDGQINISDVFEIES